MQKSGSFADMKWGRLLVRSGFLVTLSAEALTFQQEEEENRALFARVLAQVELAGLRAGVFDGTVFRPGSRGLGEDAWSTAWGKARGDAKGAGQSGALGSKDYWIAGFSRWLGLIGLQAVQCSDGQGVRNPSLLFSDEHDSRILQSLLLLISQGRWNYRPDGFLQLLHAGQGQDRRTWLPDAAELIHANTASFTNVVSAMRQVLQKL